MRVPRVALAVVVGSLVAGSVGVGVVFAPSASAVATVTTTQINCGTSAASPTVTVPTALAAGDTLVVSYTDCNNYNLTRNNFAENSVYNVNGASAQTQTLTVYAGATTAGTTLSTLTGSSGGTSKTITIVQAADPWTTKTPPTTGVLGTAYAGYTFAATGGSNYVNGSGSLPPGLALSTSGALSGTPTIPGAYTFAVTATGVSSSTGNITITISGVVISKVTICHRTRATTNPYVLITVSVNSVIGSGGGNGHSDHNTTSTNLVNPTNNTIAPGSGPFDTSWTYASNRKWWGDIIPPFSYTSGGSTLTYAGLNWGPTSGTTWAWPNPTGGTSNNWLVASDFATAVNAAPSSTYKTAVAQCMNLGAAGTAVSSITTPQGLYDLNVNAGVPPSDANSDIDTLDVGLNPYSTATPQAAVPSSATLAAAFAAQVTTVAASSVAQTQAQLNGTLALTTPTSANFEYGTDPAGTLTTTTPVSSPSTPTSAVVTGLTCGTTYYFRVVGTNSSGTYWGQFL